MMTKMIKGTSAKKFVKNKFVKNPANQIVTQNNNRNTRKRCEICSKLTIKTP